MSNEPVINELSELVSALELKEGQRYLFIFNSNMITEADVSQIIEALKDEYNISGVGLMVAGTPDESVKILEVKS